MATCRSHGSTVGDPRSYRQSFDYLGSTRAMTISSGTIAERQRPSYRSQSHHSSLRLRQTKRKREENCEEGAVLKKHWKSSPSKDQMESLRTEFRDRDRSGCQVLLTAFTRREKTWPSLARSCPYLLCSSASDSSSTTFCILTAIW